MARWKACVHKSLGFDADKGRKVASEDKTGGSDEQQILPQTQGLIHLVSFLEEELSR